MTFYTAVVGVPANNQVQQNVRPKPEILLKLLSAGTPKTAKMLLAWTPTTVIKCLAFLLFWVAKSPAQTPDSILLPTVEVRSSRLDRFAKGLIINELDSAMIEKSTSLAAALAADGTLFVRDNGPSSLATISARNLGPSRTPIVWAGLSLASPMNGVIDASLLPIAAGDRVAVQRGSSSSLFGAGAMGGTVRIEPFSRLKKGFSGHLGQRVGAFSTHETAGGAGFKSQKFEAAGRVLFQKAANDFEFKNTLRIGAPLDTQVNAAMKKLDIQLHNALIINELSRLVVDAWATVADRRLPPSMAQDASDDWQKDSSLRISVAFERQFSPRLFGRAQAGHLFEAIDFFTPAVGEKRSAATTRILQTEFFLNGKKAGSKKVETRFGSAFFHQKARVDDYADGLADQSRLALFSSQLIDYQRVTWSWSLRGEARRAIEKGSARGRLLPLTGAAGAEKRLSKNWKSRASVARSHNLPTFNDLFWATGGDPNLLAESGWSGEIGADFSKKLCSKMAFSASVTAFSTAVKNWIQWSPSAAGGGLFFPSNLRKVWSRGLEFSSKIDGSAGCNWLGAATAKAAFNPTTTTEIENPSLAAWRGKQLVYAPKWQFSSLFELKKGGFEFSSTQNFVGKRSTQADGGAFLKPVFLLGAGVSFSKKMGRSTARLALEGRNLLSKNYQMIRGRAMPGRHFQAAAQVDF